MDSSISGHAHCRKRGFSKTVNKIMTTSVDPDDTARYEPSHLDLHCLQRCVYWSAGMKGLISSDIKSNKIYIYQ